MKFKKILSVFLAAAISASSISLVSSAKAPETPQTVEETVEKTYQASGDSFVDGDFRYTELADGTLKVSSNNQPMTQAVIPSTVNGKKVTSIANKAFFNCQKLTSVTIPSSVTSIGSEAFRDCNSLTSVTIPSSVTSIGSNAFCNCTSLTSATISNGVTSIGAAAFRSSALKSITIPQSVTSIDSDVFGGCASLTAINVNANNETYCSVNGVLYNKDKTTIIRYPAGKTAESYSIPNSVTEIDRDAFYYCTNLKSVTIPSSVTSIGAWAFEYCKNLTSVTIPNGVTEISSEAFGNCESLKSITIPDSVTKIGSEVFRDCVSVTEINVGANNEMYCSVNGVLFNKDKTLLVQYPVGKTAKSYTIPDGVTYICNSAFKSCTSLTSLTIPNSVIDIAKYACYGCTGLTSITIPNSVEYIGWYAFENCTGLKSVTLSNSLKSIDSGVFAYCTSLTSITIPNSVTELANTAFSNCTSLKSVTIPDSVTSIGDFAFSHCTSLTSVTIPNSLTNILSGTFAGCTSLKSVTIPNSVTSIGNSAFDGCTDLTSVIIPNSVTEIGNYAFNYCTGLTAVKIPSSVTTIGSGAFEYCANMTSITIPKSVTSIGSWSLSSWSLKDVYYTGTEEQWNKISFGEYGNDGLQKATIHYNSVPRLTGLNAAPTGSTVKLTWDKDPEASYYKVWTWENGKLTQLTQTKNNATVAYTASNLTANTSYKFRVSAYDKNGKVVAFNDVTAKTVYGTISGLKAAPSKSSIKLTWSKNTAAAYYKVWTWESGKLTQLTQTKSNAVVTYTASKLAANTSYKYRVTAYNSSGKAIAYSDITAKTYGNIANLKAAPTSSSVKLTWSKNTAAAYYKVWTWENDKLTQLTQTTSNATVAYTASKLVGNTSYKFRVTAYDKNDKVIAYSDITATTEYGTIANLKATPTAYTVKLTWNQDTSAAYYKVWTWENDKLTLLTQTKSNATVSYTASDLAVNVSYKFRVTAYNSDGKAIAYSDITATTKYGTIASLKAAPAKNTVKLTWGKNTSANYYKVFIWKDSKWTQLTKTADNATVAYTASKLTANTSYKFRVTAYNSSGKAIAYSDITAKTTA